ncbi:Cytidylate kinase [Pirellulimonas nuda]|uniref:Cytidylate kinase n=1 Tax=Pirellulimonas nuda TaxID=2528009 RepID=A0A518DI81_9BACT|nr:(d)CMP kinase [Pirellulimonas nuda]QDU91193.1 Cytidylate kinase [Pirellulimonas nuda]
MVVTIDGPAGAGKSSAARTLAERLGFAFLDTGGMYRAVAFAALERGVELTDAEGLLRIAQGVAIESLDGRVVLDGLDVTRAVRTVRVTAATRHAADHPGVREHLVQMQRQTAEGRDLVTEGRDQSTVVFPDAQCKIFLTASERVRAERRFLDLSGRGERLSLDEVLRAQHQRDEEDFHRPTGGLIKAPDAIEVNTDGLSPEQVVERLMTLVSASRGPIVDEPRVGRPANK